MTLPSGWEVYELLSGRYLFHYDPRWNGTGGGVADHKYQYHHPDPDFDKSLYEIPEPGGGRKEEPHFEALSYVWGSIDHPDSILVESPSDKTTKSLRIGRNLALALRSLRYQDKTRTLWVDAICINQADDDEKAVQVTRMASIFSLASRVIVWLGPEQDKSAFAMGVLATIGQQVEFSMQTGVLPCPSAERPTWHRREAKLPYSREDWQRVSQLLQRPWFTRVWTVQEIALANRQALVRCGHSEMSWDLFRRAITRSWALRQEHVDFSSLSRLVPTCFAKKNTGFHLGDLLSMYGGYLCTNPRDKVYGMLALAPPKFSAQIEPSYTESVGETYKRTLLTHMRITERVEVYSPEPYKRAIEASSWVPDFPVTASAWTITPDMASGVSRTWHEYLPPDRLRIQGLRCDVIETTSDIISRDDDLSNEDVLIEKLMQFWGLPRLRSSPSPQDCPLDQKEWPELDAFCSTLYLGFVRERVPAASPVLSWKKQQLLHEIFPDALQPPRRFGHYPAPIFSTRGASEMFFRTFNGSIGCGQLRTRRGDIVCVFLGCSKPAILRPVGDDTYRLVGHPYVYDLQDAKGILGSLPSPWRVQISHSGKVHRRRATSFWNPDTGETSLEDPRLGPILSGWERIPLEMLGRELTTDDPQVCDFFRNLEDGSVIDYDPRMTPEALREGDQYRDFHFDINAAVQDDKFPVLQALRLMYSP